MSRACRKSRVWQFWVFVQLILIQRKKTQTFPILGFSPGSSYESKNVTQAKKWLIHRQRLGLEIQFVTVVWVPASALCDLGYCFWWSYSIFCKLLCTRPSPAVATAWRYFPGRKKNLHTDMAKKSKDGLRDLARAARRDRDARNTRFRVEHTHQKFHMCINLHMARHWCLFCT